MSTDNFLDLVKTLDVILDIRSHPTSKWPWFYKEEMQVWLGSKYEWDPRLGGWDKRHSSLKDEMMKYDVDISSYLIGKFPKQRIGKSRGDFPLFEKPSWTNQGLYDYSFYAILPEFLDGCSELIERGKVKNIGIMCCEALWFKCHRSMVSDFLWFRGVDSVHLSLRTTKTLGNRISSTFHSKVVGNRLERYDPRIIEIWK